MRFEGTDTYVATDDLKLAVNAALTLERPLLVKGEPGTGKTLLAEEVARGARPAALSSGTSSRRPRRSRACTSTTPCRGCAIRSSATTAWPTSRTTSSAACCGRRSTGDAPSVVLIDEIDKADIEFPNDLLRELDRMEFYVYETHETVVARHRPLVVITSNNEKELPDAFLRRCFFHYIRFPDRETMTRIVDVHFPGSRRRCSPKRWKSSSACARCRGSRRSRRPRSSSTG